MNSAQQRKLLISTKLAYHRDRLGFTQKEFAKILGVSYASYQGYERGDRNPSIESLFGLYEREGVSPAEIIFSTDELKKLVSNFDFEKQSTDLLKRIEIAAEKIGPSLGREDIWNTHFVLKKFLSNENLISDQDINETLQTYLKRD